VPDFATVGHEAKREIAAGTFGSEIARLLRVLERPGDEGARQVITSLLAAFEVYRAYVYPGEAPAPQAEAAIRAALAEALRHLPAALHPLAAEISARVLDAGSADAGSADAGNGEFATRFQQTTGPVLAKGIEDTAFYRWSRLISRNEVGGDPGKLAVTPGEFHENAGRLGRDWPLTMTTLSTHDTKRQEDVRARLAVLTEIPGEWGQQVREWHARAAPPREHGGTEPAVDPDTEYLLWQTLVGAWPLSGYRLTGYLTKVVREAKLHTSWTDPDTRYEEAVLGLGAQILGDPSLFTSIGRFVEDIAPDARVNSLGVKLVQLTMPGVADTYQGCELAGLSLVDPDNRRPVDYARQGELLAAIDAGQAASRPPAQAALDIAKLLVTSRALRLRRARPDWFTGPAASYAPLTAEGPAAGHVIAFARGGQAVTLATRLPVGLRRRGGWADTTLALPEATASRGGAPPYPPRPAGWRDVLTSRVHRGPVVPLAELTWQLPVALLVPEDVHDHL
jgi:(1->4)-alpha-D-glucan 1-alpha-D-glucosylmutase